LGELISKSLSPAESNSNENIANDALKHASLVGTQLQPEYEKNQNVVFHNQVPGTSISAPDITDHTFMDGNTTDTDLGSFLKRPVKIAEYTWTEGTTFNQSLEPWAQYFSRTPIKNKTQTFAFIRCKLKVHVQVNASPFYHGRMVVAYRPLPSWGLSTSSFSGQDTDSVTYSQRPSFWINVANSQGGDIELPFFYHKNWLTLTSAAEFSDMGILNFHSPGVLRNANSVAGTGVQIVVWAMADDIVLSGSTTALVYQSTPQKLGPNDKVSRKKNSGSRMKSKKIPVRTEGISSDAVSILKDINSGFKDEYGKGVVSTTASALAEAAGVVSTVPVVGPFATATAAAASCVAGVADYFGWTNVPNIRNVEPVHDQPFGAFASPSISTPIQKLGVDPKNELCIDSRTVGLDGTDELSIEGLVTRESYLKTFTMSDSQAVDTKLLACVTWPQLFRVSTETINSRNYTKFHHTPMSYVSEMFQFWRGDISFRFVANKTKYHAGRLMITWDPLQASPSGAAPTETHSAIWDFTQSEEFVFTVPYNQAEPWKEVPPTIPANGEYVKTDGTSFSGSPAANGQIVVTVLTKLTGPAATADIDVLLFVRGCPNLKFNDPVQLSTKKTYWRPQSSVESVDTQQIDIETTVSALSLITMGEDHISLRPLLHRTAQYVSQQFQNDSTSMTKYVNANLPRFPLVPGFDPSGFHITSIPTNPRYNFIPHTAYSWIAPMFVGMRGSVNYHVNVSSPEMSDEIALIRSHNVLSTSEFARQDDIPAASTDSAFNLHFLDNDIYSGMTGMALTNQKTQSGLSANIPMYSQFRMVPTVPVGIGSSAYGTDNDAFKVRIRLNPAGSGKNANLSYYTMYYSMGPDFNFFYFLNAPVIYYSDTPPAFTG